MTDAAIATTLNALDPAVAREALLRCCGSSRWVERMLSERPVADDDALLAAADAHWVGLEQADWLEAFAAHPRIGERRVSGWARDEQAGMAGAARGVTERMESGTRRYEAQFGFVFLICATGRTAVEMLGELERRLLNDRDRELREAAEQQRLITRLRLRKLVTP